MSTQSLGHLLKGQAKQKGYSNIWIANYTHIDKTTISKHFNDKLKISDSDLSQYCKLFKLSFDLVKQNYEQVEYFVCEKETYIKIFAGLSAVGIGAISYNIIKNKLDERCSNRYLTT